jgi:TPR repeat protein
MILLTILFPFPELSGRKSQSAQDDLEIALDFEQLWNISFFVDDDILVDRHARPALYRYWNSVVRSSAIKSAAIQIFKAAARKGNLNARVAYGICYHEAFGVPKDRARAMRHFKIVANKGMVEDQFYYTMALFDNEEDKAKAKAIKYIKLAVDQQNPVAELLFGLLLFGGNSVDKDDDAAMNYIKRSAKHGCPRGQVIYGLLYSDLNSDVKKSDKYFMRVAEQEDPMVQFMMRLRSFLFWRQRQ